MILLLKVCKVNCFMHFFRIASRCAHFGPFQLITHEKQVAFLLDPSIMEGNEVELYEQEERKN